MTTETAGTLESTQLSFVTTADTILAQGQLSTQAPIQATLAGTIGNVGANTIDSFASDYIFGITTVANPLPTSGGYDAEDDDALKVRFKNTVFRNLAGTQDQYAALAAATQYTTKANVVGPISRYREYVEVPSGDDASTIGTPAQPGNSLADHYSTALSTVPYAKHTYDVVPAFVSNGERGAEAVFYRRDTDWLLNTTGKDVGEAHRDYVNAVPGALDPATDTTHPNVTFTNVYTGSDDTVVAVRPGDILLFEHSYLSTASRNDATRNLSNAVDVFIDGVNATSAEVIIPMTPINYGTVYNNVPNQRLNADNFRMDGFPEINPPVGYVWIPLFWAPVTQLPRKSQQQELSMA